MKDLGKSMPGRGNRNARFLDPTVFEICRNKKSQVPEVQLWGRDAGLEIRKAAKNQRL